MIEEWTYELQRRKKRFVYDWCGLCACTLYKCRFCIRAGIAKVFADKYGVKIDLLTRCAKNEWDGNGRCELSGSNMAEDGTGCWIVANLVTKEKCYHKPAYDTLRQALLNMRCKLLAHGLKRVGMPLIGCGLDGLEWNKVSKIIKEVFADTDIEILVCYL